MEHTRGEDNKEKHEGTQRGIALKNTGNVKLKPVTQELNIGRITRKRSKQREKNKKI